jgi:hypothetical protein
VPNKAPRYYFGEVHPYEMVSFGTVTDGLDRALNSKEREEFVSAFKRRNVGSGPMATFAYLTGESGEGELSPPPAPCQHCYKMLGV